MYGIKVKFKGISGVWSKEYTYSSPVPYEKNDVVVVPTSDFYSIGRVSASIENYEFNKALTYKGVHSKVLV